MGTCLHQRHFHARLTGADQSTGDKFNRLPSVNATYSSMNKTYDIAIIGAGIAGTTVAARLVDQARVVLLESESQPAYHTTGRSAALFLRSYGPAPIRALTRASEAFFQSPLLDFRATSAESLLTERSALTIATEDKLAQLEAMRASLSEYPEVRMLDAEQTRAIAPYLRPDFAAAGLLEPTPWEIDVHRLMELHLTHYRSNGGRLLTDTAIEHIRKQGDHWQLTTRNGSITAGIVVNAAGAWAGELGLMAGAMDIGLTPKRRTAMIIDKPDTRNWQCAADDMPVIADVDESFYLKSDAGRLLISPADETPSAPCDAQPEELDIAICVDRIETAFDIEIGRIQRAWAGLRSFVADKCPVCGYDPSVDNFFWLAGQGGYGIQTSPALSAVAASLVLGQDIPGRVTEQGLNPADISPARFG